MGEAKRRKKLLGSEYGSNYGKSKVLKYACQHIDDLLLQIRKSNWNQEAIFSLFTNNDRGCTKEELKLLEKEIPKRYEGKKFTIWVLPKKYAHLPVDKALNYFVPIEIGRTQR